MLQLAVKRLLEAIYEQDFLSCSYGYRPLVGARAAVDELRVKLQFGGYHHLVEADIQRPRVAKATHRTKEVAQLTETRN